MNREPCVFDLQGFSLDTVSDLLVACDQGEGSLFQNSVREIELQTTFLLRVLRPLCARGVLETGTHKANFCYLVHLVEPEARVDTFGIDLTSRACVDLLNQRFGDFVTFHAGDSKATLAAFAPVDAVDFAWIDGGHDLATCLSDLVHCERLGVPVVCVDDCRGEPGVADALRSFLARSTYRLVEVSDDVRGIAHLRSTRAADAPASQEGE